MKNIDIGQQIKSKIKTGPASARSRIRSQVYGHRGTAYGTGVIGKRNLSPENQAKWERLGTEVVEGFVHDGQLLVVHSSNLSFARYLIDEEKLIIVYKNGKGYEYSYVHENEAIHFAQTLSKGMWVWDHLRVRGTKNGHRKPYKPLFFTDQELAVKSVTSMTSKFHAFITQGEILPIDKEGISFARYLDQEKTLIVMFADSKAFEYANMDQREALGFAQAKNKQDWLQRFAKRKPQRALFS